MKDGRSKVTEHIKKKDAGKSEEPPAPKKPPKASHEIYYDLSAGKYYFRLGNEFKAFREEALGRVLRSRGFHREGKHDNTLSFLEQELMRIQLECGVSYAGELAGYPAGEHEVCGRPVLVTRGPRLPAASKRPYPTLAKFLGELFPPEGKPFFLGWLKMALRSLHAGPPWSPGQALILCGPAGCGKNLLQSLITEMFGGRLGKPYRYMSGDTNFNRDLLTAEHLAIQDEVEHPDYRARRFFGARIKDFTVNEVQSYHAKGLDAFNLTPFWRLSVSLNEEVENLQILPPIETGIADKLLLFRCRPTNLPASAEDPVKRAAFRQTLTDEIPGFLFWLKRWRIPDAIKDPRFGVRAYADPSLVEEIQTLSPEAKFWQLVEGAGLWDLGDAYWLGSASELERKLREKFRGDCERLLRWSNAAGVFLEKLSHQYPARILRERGPDNTRHWQLLPPASTNGSDKLPH